MESTQPHAPGSSRLGSEDAPSASTASAQGYYVPPKPEPTPQDALRDLGSRLTELKAYAGYLVTAKLDGIKVSLRNAVFYAALGVVAGLAGAAIIVTAGVLVVLGLSSALAMAFSAMFGAGWAWLGPLLVGLLVLGAVVAGTYLFISRMMNASRERTVRKYEQLQREQHAQYGHSVSQRATEAAAKA